MPPPTERRVLGARLHPGYESEWPPETRPANARTRAAPIVPPALRTTSIYPRTGPQWAVGITAVLTALGTLFAGVGYVVTEYRKTAAASSEEITRRLDTIDATLKTMKQDQIDRDLVNLAVQCELNGGPPAKNVRCPPNACEPPLLDVHGAALPGQPRCKATIDWPPIRR
jgi:hypothetical protein